MTPSNRNTSVRSLRLYKPRTPAIPRMVQANREQSGEENRDDVTTCVLDFASESSSSPSLPVASYQRMMSTLRITNLCHDLIVLKITFYTSPFCESELGLDWFSSPKEGIRRYSRYHSFDQFHWRHRSSDSTAL